MDLSRIFEMLASLVSHKLGVALVTFHQDKATANAKRAKIATVAGVRGPTCRENVTVAMISRLVSILILFDTSPYEVLDLGNHNTGQAALLEPVSGVWD